MGVDEDAQILLSNGMSIAAPRTLIQRTYFQYEPPSIEDEELVAKPGQESDECSLAKLAGPALEALQLRQRGLMAEMSTGLTRRAGHGQHEHNDCVDFGCQRD